MQEQEWTVYIIRTKSDKLYTGITKDMERRFSEHKEKKSGARFFHTSDPAEIMYQETQPDRSTASKRESEIKKMTRKQKLALINSQK